MTPDPDRPAPDPSPLADRLADLQARTEMIDARELTPLISHAERVEAELAAARREAEALMGLIVRPFSDGWSIGIHVRVDGVDIGWIGRKCSTREGAETLVRKAAGLPPDVRPAGDAGGDRVGDDGDFPARVRRHRAAMEAEGLSWENPIHLLNDFNAGLEGPPLPSLAARDDSGETMLGGLARLAARCEIAARAVAAGLPDPPPITETFDRLRELSRGGDWSDVLEDDEDEAPSLAALRAPAEDYWAKWEDALARLDAVTGTLALYGRRAEAGRELARAWLEWCRRIESGDPATFFDGTSDRLREMALRVLARSIGERDGGETPGEARQRPPVAPETLPTAGMESGASAADGGQGGALRASDEAESGDWPEDSGHENGDYENRCVQCGRTFTGHKRRVFCRVCAKPDESEPGPASPRPCPFCGSEDAGPIVEGPDDLPRHRVRCPDCWARGPVDFDDAEAIGYWNAAWDRRAEAAPGIDAGAVERVAGRIVWALESRGRAFSPREIGMIAEAIRESLGLAPAAGDAIEKGHAPHG